MNHLRRLSVEHGNSRRRPDLKDLPLLPRTGRRATRSIALGSLILTGLVMPPFIARAANAGADSDYELRRASQETFRHVAERLHPSLVRIETVGGTQPIAFAGEDGEENAQGAPRRSQNPFRDDPGSAFVVADGATTGIVHSADGYIVTSSFNFVREPALISVTLADGRRLAADLVARDQVRKIALLKVDATDLSVPEWRSLDDVRVGEWAVALGLGFGGDHPSVTVGIVSALQRMHGNAVQTDAKLSPANYGGPLCDIDGRIIGLCVPMAQRPGELAGIELYDAGVGFAVPKRIVDGVTAELKKGRSFHRGWLGVAIDPHSAGSLVIGNVADPSPMRTAGVQPGDKLLAINGHAIQHYGHLVQAIYMLPAGEEVKVDIERDGESFSALVELARSDELGSLPELPEPFDPSNPLPQPEEDSTPAP
jgi:serine protease Do